MNGYRHVKFHVHGKRFGQMTRGEIRYLRNVAAATVLIPPSFVLIDGIDPSRSVVVTLQFPDQHATILKDMLETREVEVAELIELGVDCITVGEIDFPLIGLFYINLKKKSFMSVTKMLTIICIRFQNVNTFEFVLFLDEQYVSSEIVTEQEVDISIRLHWEKEKIEKLQKENEKQADKINELEKHVFNTSRECNLSKCKWYKG